MKTKPSLLSKRIRPLDALLTSLAPLVWLALLESLSRADFGSFCAWLVQKPLMAFMNLALLWGVGLLLSLVVSDRRRILATLVLTLFFAVLGVANHYKLVYRLEPILLTDITQLGDLKATVTGLKFDIDLRPLLLMGCLFLVLCAATCALVKTRRVTRPVLPAALGLMLVLLLPRLCTFELAGGGAYTDMGVHARNEGSLYAAIAMENHREALMRVDYDEGEVRASYDALAQQAQQTASEAALSDQQPNLIVVLSESFADEAWLSRYLTLTDTLMPFYQQLMKECQTGMLYVPKIGGGTSETEFEVLTGLQSKYSVNPYSMGLPSMNSVASVLRERGYEATTLHWYTGVYYNRYRNLKMEGFNSFYTTDTTTTDFEKKGMFVSDREHFNAIVNQLETSDKRDLVFCLTMQSHGGYGYDDFRKTYGADVPFADKLTPESEKIVANYCWLLRQTDEALREFIARLRALDEPTVLVFFGDHIPPLGTQVYEEIGVPTEGDEGHWTPYFIWSNQSALSGKTDMKAYQLGAYALDMIGVRNDPFLHYVETLRRANVAEDATYDLLSYDALFGKQYAYDEGGLSPVTDDFQIGGRMTLSGFDAAVIGDAVYLRPHLAVKDQEYDLEVNGQAQDTRYLKLTDEPFTLACVMRSASGLEYNRSNAIAYQSTSDLLAQSGELGYAACDLWRSDFVPERDKWYQGYALYKSAAPLAHGGSTALTVADALWNWQPTYGISRGAQYAVAADGTVYLAVPKSALDAYGRDAESVKRYLRDFEATLYTFDE